MKTKLLLFLALFGISTSVFARDVVKEFSISNALSLPEAQNIIDKNIKLSFGNGYKGIIVSRDVQSNKKTNAFNKTEERACNIAFLSAIRSLQDNAKKSGATNVINITGYYKKQPFNSKTKFQCGTGVLMAGVTLRADIAK